MVQKCEINNQLEPFLNYLAKQLSPVIFGSKPAILLGLHCWGKLDTCPIFIDYQQEIQKLFGVKATIFSKNDKITQVYFYREKLVQKSLDNKIASKILKDHGYNSLNAKLAIKELSKRFSCQTCPHEIGIFLGYPPKDVAGYIAGAKPVQGVKTPWRVYGKVAPSIKLVKKHKVARKAMKLLLDRYQSIYRCMEKLAPVVNKPA